MIATPRGEIAVERLRVGDTVITRDNGIRPILWVGSRRLPWSRLAASPHLRPILIRQGSLGHGLPEADLLVSPNHRILVTAEQTTLHLDAAEALVAAKHVVSGRLVTRIESAGATYVHFVSQRHEIVLANGIWTEAFQPADQTLKGVGNAQRGELVDLFPELHIPPARAVGAQPGEATDPQRAASILR